MKTLWNAPLLTLALAGSFGGCSSGVQPLLPALHNPVTYQVPVGHVTPTRGQPSYGATQDVVVEPGQPVYYRITSPVAVSVYYYEKTGAAPNGNLLGHLSVPAGRPVSARIVPATSTLEFLFTPAATAARGDLQFTLSDRPLSMNLPAETNPPATFPGD